MTRNQNFTVVAKYQAPDWKCGEVRRRELLLLLYFFREL
jgi:hypothetical protein